MDRRFVDKVVVITGAAGGIGRAAAARLAAEGARLLLVDVNAGGLAETLACALLTVDAKLAATPGPRCPIEVITGA